MSLKAKVEAIIYATEEPVTLNQLVSLLKDTAIAELQAEETTRLALNETVSDGPADSVDYHDIPEPEDEPSDIATELAQPPVDTDDSQAARDKAKQELSEINRRIAETVEHLIAEYSAGDRGMEIRQIAGGYRMTTKPEHHDVVVQFAKSLKPPIRLSLQALETLAVIAYKQPVTVPEISEIRGVDTAGVIATLLDRKLVTTAGRKQVIGRPILYKTTKEFLMRFGLKDIGELPSMEEFEKLGDPQAELFQTQNAQAASAATEAPAEADAAGDDQSQHVSAEGSEN